MVRVTDRVSHAWIGFDSEIRDYYWLVYIKFNQGTDVPRVSAPLIFLTLHIDSITGILACKRGIHSDFETQRRRHLKSKTGVSAAPQKGLMSSKEFWKKTRLHLHLRPLSRLSHVSLTVSLSLSRFLIERELPNVSLHWMTFIFRRSCELHTCFTALQRPRVSKRPNYCGRYSNLKINSRSIWTSISCVLRVPSVSFSSNIISLRENHPLYHYTKWLLLLEAHVSCNSDDTRVLRLIYTERMLVSVLVL